MPRRKEGADLTDLPLTPIEGYVLSQIDGHTPVTDLEMIVGLPADELQAVLHRLTSLGLLERGPTAMSARGAARPAILPDRPPTEPPQNRPTEPPESARRGPRAASASRTVLAPEAASRAAATPEVHPPMPSSGRAARGHGPFAPEELQRIDKFLVRANSADFYRLLGVGRKAERSEIRVKYFALAKEFHPDAYFGRELGDTKAKLERIFRQITRAYEVLSRSKSRKEYDEYLKGQAVLEGQEEEEKAWEAEEQRRKSHEPPGPREADRPAMFAAPPADERPPAAPEVLPATEVPRESAAASPGRPDAASADAAESLSSPAEERSIETASAQATTAAPAGIGASATWRRERMARQLAAVLGASRQRSPQERRGSDYLAEAEVAAKEEEWGRVFGLLDAADKLGLKDAEQPRFVELRKTAGEQLARISASQARFAESTGDLQTALRHAESACKYGATSAESWDAVARLRLRMGADLHLARDAAMRAIALAPKVVSFRVTMARVYMAAGLSKNARREAEAALELEPGDRAAKTLLAEAKQAQG